MADLTARRAAIVAEARAWLGTPYHHGASLKGVGCDCLGLVRGVWRAVVGPEPAALPLYDGRGFWAFGAGVGQGGRRDPKVVEKLLEELARHFRAVPLAAAGPGDVIAFRGRRDLPAHHLGLLVAPGRLVHVPRARAAVEVGYGPALARRAVAAFAFPGEQD